MADGDRIGLLFVHGIGQPKPFDHLRESVSQLAELFNRIDNTSITVDDRTAKLTDPIGVVTAEQAQAPITLTVTRGIGEEAEVCTFECHEVYWADLADRSGVMRQIGFWFWALGQWCAPIYRDADAALLDKQGQDQPKTKTWTRPISSLVRLPRSVGGYLLDEIRTRAALAFVALLTFFTLITWSLGKRLVGKIIGTVPGPSLIVDYVDKVRTYEEPASPNDSALSDPGFPRRVGIRRRMVTQMVAMGARQNLNGWYVLGHSLGSVVAYNGLTEIGHALPNYLAQDQWDRLVRARPSIARDICDLRKDTEIPFMMPSRPVWLERRDVINRALLFEGLRGFVTYGSPLDLIAAIWPRILATAADRWQGGEPAPPFPETCQWVNLCTPLDPVATVLLRFGARKLAKGESLPDTSPGPHDDLMVGPWVPRPQTYRTARRQWYLYAHLEYLANTVAYDASAKIEQRIDLARWLDPQAHGDSALNSRFSHIGLIDTALFVIASLFVFLALAVAAAGLVTVLGGIGWKLLTAGDPVPLPAVQHALGQGMKAWCAAAADIAAAMRSAFVGVVAAALVVVLIAGLCRWMTESWTNWRLLKATLKWGAAVPPGTRSMVAKSPDGKTDKNLARVIALQRSQLCAAAIMACAILACLLAGLILVPLTMVPIARIAGAGIALAVVIQALINLYVAPARAETSATAVPPIC